MDFYWDILWEMIYLKKQDGFCKCIFNNVKARFYKSGSSTDQSVINTTTGYQAVITLVCINQYVYCTKLVEMLSL